MSTFFFLVFVAVCVLLFGAAGWHAHKQRREFKRGWAELEKELDEI